MDPPKREGIREVGESLGRQHQLGRVKVGVGGAGLGGPWVLGCGWRGDAHGVPLGFP